MLVLLANRNSSPATTVMLDATTSVTDSPTNACVRFMHFKQLKKLSEAWHVRYNRNQGAWANSNSTTVAIQVQLRRNLSHQGILRRKVATAKKHSSSDCKTY